MAVIPIRQGACQLFDPEGALLTGGVCRPAEVGEADELLVSHLDTPGRLVLRCLVGGLRLVWVQPAGGRLLPAVVQDVVFDRQRGRECRLRLSRALTAATLAGRHQPQPSAVHLQQGA